MSKTFLKNQLKQEHGKKKTKRFWDKMDIHIEKQTHTFFVLVVIGS